DPGSPAPAGHGVGGAIVIGSCGLITGWESVMGIVVLMKGQANLLEVILALHAVGRLPHLLNRRQEQTDQDADDGNDHEQFNQAEGTPKGRPTHRNVLLVFRPLY